MSLDSKIISALADRVERAQLDAKAITKLTDEHPSMTVADGYLVQDELRRRSEARGCRIVGFKAGLTSQAKMKQMGVSLPAVGFLANDMYRPDGGTIDTKELVHPRIEPEVAFVTKSALRGASLTIDDVIAATDFVLPAVEVIDSRYENFRFDLPSVIADNTSSARYVTGGRARNPADLDLRTLGVVVEKNGQIAALGASAAVLGHPALAVAMLVRHLSENDRELPAGSFVMTGGITEAIAVTAGDHISVRIQELGTVSFRFI